MPVERDDDIPPLDSCTLRWAACHNLGHERPTLMIQAEGLRQLWRDRLRLDPLARLIGVAKPIPCPPAPMAAFIPDNFALQVEQWPPTVAG